MCFFKNCFSQDIDIKSINKGEIAGINGYIFSDKAEEKLKDINETKKSLEKDKISLEKLNNINSEEIKNLEDKIKNENEISKEYSSQLDREKSRNTFNKVLYFIGGGAVGILLFKAKK